MSLMLFINLDVSHSDRRTWRRMKAKQKWRLQSYRDRHAKHEPCIVDTKCDWYRLKGVVGNPSGRAAEWLHLFSLTSQQTYSSNSGRKISEMYRNCGSRIVLVVTFRNYEHSLAFPSSNNKTRPFQGLLLSLASEGGLDVKAEDGGGGRVTSTVHIPRTLDLTAMEQWRKNNEIK